MKEKFKKHPYLYCTILLLIFIGVAGHLIVLNQNAKTDKQVEIELEKMQKRGIPITFRQLKKMYPSPPKEENCANYYELAFTVLQKSNVEFPVSGSKEYESERKLRQTEKDNLKRLSNGEGILEIENEIDYLQHYRDFKKLFTKTLKTNEKVFVLLNRENQYISESEKEQDILGNQSYPINWLNIQDIEKLFTIKAWKEIDEKKYTEAQQSVCDYFRFLRYIQNNYFFGAIDRFETNYFSQSTLCIYSAANIAVKHPSPRLKQEIELFLDQLESSEKRAAHAEFVFIFQKEFTPQTVAQMGRFLKLPIWAKYRPKYMENEDKLALIALNNILFEHLDGQTDIKQTLQKRNESPFYRGGTKRFPVTAFYQPSFQLVYQTELIKKRWRALAKKL